MASSMTSPFLALVTFMAVFNFPCHAAAGNYTAIFNFGDSLSDTGNFHLTGVSDVAGNPPYGETFFHKPTGRYSDGRLIIDFIAQVLELPLLRPYLAGGKNGDFRTGANFAVVGATALDVNYYKKLGLNVTWTKYSLSFQMDWFKRVFSGSDPSKNILRTALVLMGEIGGNDYINMLTQRKTIDETQNIVPVVVNLITSSAESLINEGATRLVVPGITPLGCVALILTIHQGIGIPGDLDPQTGCLTALNDFAQYHNQMLKTSVQQLQTKYPDVTISYADYYEGFMSIYRSPSDYGFEVALAACCGGDGPYNVSMSFRCGDAQAKVCSDPSTYVGWDGVHYTEAAYNFVADGLINGLYTNPPILL